MSLFDDDDLNDNDALDAVADVTTGAPPAIPEPRNNPDLFAHAATETQLLNWWETGTMPHTLILSGPHGIGKATLAYRLARFLLATPPPGGDGLFGAEPTPKTLAIAPANPVFARVASGGHPDMMSLSRTLNDKTGHMHGEILVDAVREVPMFLRRTASEGGWRVVVIDEAETLNRNSQNALLKILEEPPPKALLILVTQAAGALIPTIRSRARVVQVTPPEEADFTALLRKLRPDLSAPDTALLAQISGNAPGRALALLDQGGMDAIHGVVDMLETLPAADDGAIWTMAEKLSIRSTPDPLAGMLDVSVWALQDRARNAALENATAPMSHYLQTLDLLERHRAMCEKGNLDRRHTALGALRILQTGLKAA